tara:strand:- start:434 stop:658 length:225 start_codon:yes stop_codon:yes gene_type:complete
MNPKKIPNKASEIKCTPRITLDNPASAGHIINNFIVGKKVKIIKVDIVEAEECPEGKLYLSGGFTKHLIFILFT